jgi:hypothetical protein
MNHLRLPLTLSSTFLLCSVLASCTPSTPPAANNQPPEAAAKLADGTPLSVASFVSPTQNVVFAVSDPDGAVVKLFWELDTGESLFKSGEYNRSEIRAKVDYQLPNLNGGAHTLMLTVTDDLGKIGRSVSNFKVDSFVPVVTSVTLNGKSQPNGTTISYKKGDLLNLAATATDARGGGDTSASVPTVSVYLGDSAAALKSSSNGVLAFDLASALSAGLNLVRIEATDSVGNKSTAYSLTFSQQP